MPHTLARVVRSSSSRCGIPIGLYPGLQITGATVGDAVREAGVQCAAQIALHERFRTPLIHSAMDLSVEAEAFGCEIRFDEGAIPTVAAPLLATPDDIRVLAVPSVGDRRTRVSLDAVALMRRAPSPGVVLGTMIGPFSLAGQLLGMTQALSWTLTAPAPLHALIEKTTAFLLDYALAIRECGADGVLVAEPMAGLLSPRDLGVFSSAYVRRIVESVESERFAVVLHNCGARLAHLPQILESGVSIVHFGAPMDIAGALSRVSPHVVVAGNLDPSGVFCGSAADVGAHTRALLNATAAFPNFVASSGCDLPPGTPLENLDAFYSAVSAFSPPEVY